MTRWPASTLHCRRCGAEVGAPVEEVVLAEPVFFAEDGAPSDPRHEPLCSLEPGTLWRAAPEVFGPDLDLIVHPSSAEGLRRCGSWVGCCGPAGADGPNLACPAGHPVATRVADCYTADFVGFARDRVEERPATRRVLPERTQILGEPPITSLPQLVAALHACLTVSGWHGEDLEALVLDHATGPGEPVCIYWVDAAASVRAGLPVARALAAFARARRAGAGASVLVPK